MRPSPEDKLYDAAEASGRFRPAAFLLILRSLERAQRRRGRRGHVSGVALLESLRELVREEYGPMALTVLHHMGLHSTEDVGELVFYMVERELLRKREEDTIEEFRDVYDFEEAFTYRW
jgi:uncharacterized repeat protein (TIGR04138 family)